jgi:hypothetical protein
MGATIGAAITATGTKGRTATHTVAPAGGGHPRAASGCAAAATATARPTAIIEGDRVIATVGAALGHMAAVGTSAKCERQTRPKQLSGTPAPERNCTVRFTPWGMIALSATQSLCGRGGG